MDELFILSKFYYSDTYDFYQTRVIAIRREDQSVWERRAPFSPNNVKRLVKNNVKVIVQPSNRRAYPMQVCIFLFLLCSIISLNFPSLCIPFPVSTFNLFQSYINAGAVVQEDISEASVIFGVKQVPVEQLIPNKTYCMFSHVIKAQESNMPLLDAIMEKVIIFNRKLISIIYPYYYIYFLI